MNVGSSDESIMNVLWCVVCVKMRCVRGLYSVSIVRCIPLHDFYADGFLSLLCF